MNAQANGTPSPTRTQAPTQTQAPTANEDKLRDYLRRATNDLRQARRRLSEFEAREREPIAVVAMACRFPGGVESPADLWRLVDEGGDAVGDFPTDRGWDLETLYHPDPDHPGTTYARTGGFLHSASGFDAGFFAINPREAAAMDPQQRLLLETSWEAFEQAGIDPAAMRGSRTGVFVGVISQDYGLRPSEVPAGLEGYLLTGTTTSVASGRLAYTFGLEGPAVTIDTACSSSLVALHLAAQALRQGECDMALAGGVTVIAAPGIFTEFSRQRGLAPDGRCKAFAAGADGTGWGEGVGLLLVERLSDARRNGHRVLAVVRGSAVNQDGASNGLTAPNGPSQERVIRAALADARLTADRIDAVEAHGTGTSLGDPIEAQALLAVYGRERASGHPLWLGSVKSNIGHTQAAAGVAGVIKTVEAMQHGVLPRTLHVDAPSTHVDWTAGAVELLTEARQWPQTGEPRRAAVSSFGVSGTNAHVIIEQAPQETASETPDADGGSPRTGHLVPWTVSARSGEALRGQAARLRALVDGPRAADVGHALAVRRHTFTERAVVLGRTGADLAAGLDALAAGAERATVATGTVTTGGLGFLLSGQGSQRASAGRELAAAFPVFADALGEVWEAFAAQGIDLGSVWDDAEALSRTEFAQAGIFAVEVALARLLEDWGVRPDLLIGHSIGELTAAHVAGVWSLDDAVRLVAARGRLMQGCRSDGSMLAVEASEEEVLAAGLPEGVVVAAVNGPASVVLSGDTPGIAVAESRFRESGRRVSLLRVSHAFHSPHMDGMLEEFRAVAESVTYAKPTIPVVSNLTGALAGDEILTADYWVRHVREAVRFADGVQAARAEGVTRFLEVGPDSVLASFAADDEVTVTAALRRERPEEDTLLTAVARLWTIGVPVDWTRVLPTPSTRHIDLPTYAFQHDHYWIRPRSGAPDLTSAGLGGAAHPLFGAAVALADTGGAVFTGRFSRYTHPWLADHVVMDTVLLPGTAFLELASWAGEALGTGRVEDLTIEAPLVLDATGAVRIQVAVGPPDASGGRSVSVHSRADDAHDAHDADGEEAADTWVRHASGRLVPASAPTPPGLAEWPPPAAEPVVVDGLYDGLASVGFAYGPTFQGLKAAWRSPDGRSVHAELRLPDEDRADAAEYGIHPALLDSALHALGLGGFLGNAHGADAEEADAPSHLPFAWSGVGVHAAGAADLRVTLTAIGPDTVTLTAWDTTGAPVLSVDSLVLRRVTPAQLAQARGGADRSRYRVTWRELPTQAPPEDPPGVLAVVGAEPGLLPGATAYPDLAALLADDSAPPPTTVLLPVGGPSARAATATALENAQRWLADERFHHARLAVVTRGAVSPRPGLDVPDPASAAVWGLIRSAQTENPGRFLLVDVDRAPDATPDLRAVLAVADEPQLAVRDGVVHVPRLVPGTTGADELQVPPGDDGAWRLDVTAAGTLENLALLPVPDAARPLAEGEVRIAVRAVGLNFRDVLIALGMYPGAARIGSEAAGVVLDVGPGVARFAPGDRVFGMVDGGAGPRAVTDSRLLARIPVGWSFTDAAVVPIVYLTAYYALVDLAGPSGVGPGTRVLVHSAAGGVGTAAVQLARHLGAEVYGTASPGKWDALRGLGLDDAHIGSSRTLDFEQAFLEATGGQGVDVVLDALAREFVDASLRLLPRGGRFLEMGKADVRDPDTVAGDHPGVAYRAFDLTDAGPDRIRDMLADLLALFDAGALRLPPITVWDVRRSPEAFRHLGQARHVGKVALTVPPQGRTAGTVLVTGAAGSLGSLVARHLVEAHGVGRLLLVGRRGADTLAAELTALGADAVSAACDVSDRDAVAGLLGGLDPEYPLTGVVHCAGVVDDGVLGSLSPERVDDILRPKADGADVLDELTRAHPLDFFVLFSSLAGTVGSAGQGGYAAANAYLDALALRRTAAGLPATSLAWGLWDDPAGMAGGLGDADRARLGRSGMLPLDAAAGLALLDAALASPEPVPVLVRLDVDAVRAAPGGVPALLRELVAGRPRRRASQSAQAAAPTSLAAGLAALPPADRMRELAALVRGNVAAVLGHASADTVDPERPFTDLGFDSLTAVELRNRLNTATGVRLPATVVFDYPTASALTGHLLGELLGAAAVDDAPGGVAQRNGGAPDDDPVVIVGMACRYPGQVRSPEDLWQLVANGVDAVGPLPDNRGWDLDALYHPDPEHPGTSYARSGGFLYDADLFDAPFFGISPREALAADPQQRQLLETAWEVFEHAGIDPGTLKGSRTGVFVGASDQDYAPRVHQAPEGVEGYLLTGTTTSVASGRVSYTFGLEGPAVTVDTACSSSLVALHLAAAAVRRGECSMALAGGVSVMATPATFVEFSRQRGLSPDGRCKAFAAGADGTGWGEGVGWLLVERLSDARANGHRVWATVRGSAVNQDGASNGLTAPNGPAQQRVIRAALADAGLSAGQVDAVEAHGTGTALGDPIEAQALLATYGGERPDGGPLWLGSLKSNIGHTQAAAGVGGVIKMVMAMRAGVLPRTLHVDEPTPHVDWSSGAVELLTQARDWPETGEPRRAAVSSFGVSGTNAHIVLEGVPEPAPEPAGPTEAPSPAVAWPLSARDPRALAARARALRAAAPDGDVAHALASTRAALEERAVVVGRDRESLLAGLHTLGNDTDTDTDGVVRGTAADPGRTVFVFPGQGSQWPGMAAELLDEHTVFAEQIAACEQALAPHVDWSLTDTLRQTPGAPPLDRVDVVQPTLWAVMVSLAALWRAAGVEPDAVVGHSQGEIAAACVAGALSLDDAARIVALRSRALLALSGAGGMVSVLRPVDEVAARVAVYGGRLAVAAVNGAASTVVSGDDDAVEAFTAACEADGLRARRIPVDYASHSAHVERIRDELARVLAPVTPRAGEVPFYSTVTGTPVDTTTLDGAYWYTNLRDTVRFEDATRRLLADGYRTFVEVSPHPVLTVGLQETFEDADEPGARAFTVPTLRRDDGGRGRFLTALAEAWIRGVRVDWPAVLPAADAAVRTPAVLLPTYPFQGTRFWLEASAHAGDPAGLGLDAIRHPLLGAAVGVATGDLTVLTGRLSTRTHPWLADHAVADTVLLPGTAFVELALAAGETTGCPVVDDLTVEAPLVLPESGDGVDIQVVVAAEADGTGRRAVAVHARTGDGNTWHRHASGNLLPDAADGDDAGSASAWPPPGALPVPGTAQDLYDRLDAAGYAYGPTFRGLRAAWRRDAELYAEVSLPDGTAADGFTLHPALLDAALHVLGHVDRADAAVDDQADVVRLPFSWNGVRVRAGGAGALRVRLAPVGDDTYALDVSDGDGVPVASVTALVLRPVPTARLREAAGRRHHDDLYAVEWVPVAGGGVAPGDVAVLDDLAPDATAATILVPALPSGDDADTVARTHDAAARLLAVLQARLADDRHAAATFVVVTAGAVPARAGAHPVDPVGAALWGLAAAADAEHPGRVRLVDLDPGAAATLADAVPTVARALAAGEPRTAVRAGTVLAPRLARIPRTDDRSAAAPTLLPPDTTVLVTGASGTLGGLVAHHLVQTYGVRRLVLAARRGIDEAEGSRALVDDLTALGAEVTWRACDVADRADLEALLAEISDAHPLSGVVHTAGVLDDGVLASLTRERLSTVLRPKVDAAWLLHDLTRGLDLSLFVLFSSAAGTLGNPGQANYAAANAFLDALAHRRRAQGLPALAAAWGRWEQPGGMTGHLDRADLARINRSGVAGLGSAEALALLDTALTLAPDHPHLLPVRLDLAALRARHDTPPLFHGLLGPAGRRTATASPDSGDAARRLVARLGALPEAERADALLGVVRTHVATVLGHADAAAVEDEQAFKEAGFDSLMGVELRNRLGAAVGLRLPTTLVFDHPTPGAVARHVLGKLAIGVAPVPDPASDPASVLAELDRLEGALGRLAADGPVREQVASRLRRAAARWADPAPAEGAVAITERLDGATTDDLFAFIDRELGRKRDG